MTLCCIWHNKMTGLVTCLLTGIEDLTEIFESEHRQVNFGFSNRFFFFDGFKIIFA